MTTTWAPPVAELPARAVKADRWDIRWWEQAVDVLDELRDAQTSLVEVHEAGGDGLADVWSILSKARPEVEREVRLDRVVNQRISEELLAAEGTQDLREFTVGSQAKTALGTLSMVDRLRELYEELEDVQEKADAAQEAQDKLDQLLAAAGGGGGGGEDEGDEEGDGEGEGQGSGDGDDGDADGEPEDGDGDGDGEGGDVPTDEEIEAAAQAAEEARADLEAALDEAGPKIGRACREAATEAAEDAEEREASMAAWGVNPGEWDRMDPADFMAEADKLDTPELRAIARIFGAMQNLRIGARREKIEAVPTEIWDVELGNDIARLLPSEYVGLIVPELRDDFYRKYAGRQLLQYRLRSNEWMAQGGIVLCEDASGSMAGAKFRWAKAFGLALGAIAGSENRAFHVIEFGWGTQHRYHDFPDKASWTTAARLAYAGSFLNSGGTDIMPALDAAVAKLNAEHEETGRVSGDIVLATDGLFPTDDEWLEGFLAEKARLGFKVYALMIGTDASIHSTARFADFAGTVTALSDGRDVRDVFKAL